jgi:hypothetical protein
MEEENDGYSFRVRLIISLVSIGAFTGIIYTTGDIILHPDNHDIFFMRLEWLCTKIALLALAIMGLGIPVGSLLWFLYEARYEMIRLILLISIPLLFPLYIIYYLISGNNILGKVWLLINIGDGFFEGRRSSLPMNEVLVVIVIGYLILVCIGYYCLMAFLGFKSL